MFAPALLVLHICVSEARLEAAGCEQVSLIDAKFALKQQHVFFSHLLPLLKFLSGNRPYPEILQDVKHRKSQVRESCCCQDNTYHKCFHCCALPDWSQPLSFCFMASFPHDRLQMRSNALETVCSTFPVYNKKLQIKAFLESALFQQRCLNCSVELKVVLIKLGQLTGFPQANQDRNIYEVATHCCKHQAFHLSYILMAGSVHDNPQLIFAVCPFPSSFLAANSKVTHTPLYLRRRLYDLSDMQPQGMEKSRESKPSHDIWDLEWCKVNTLHRKKNKSMQLELVPKEPRPHDYTSHGKRGWQHGIFQHCHGPFLLHI